MPHAYTNIQYGEREGFMKEERNEERERENDRDIDEVLTEKETIACFKCVIPSNQSCIFTFQVLYFISGCKLL